MEPKTHCKLPMRFIGDLSLEKKVNIGFPLEAGNYHTYSCEDPECDQVDFTPFTTKENK